MKYLVIDGLLHGTGVRDYYEGGYIYPEDLGLSSDLIKKLNDWLLRYEEEHYNGFSDIKLVDHLDIEGKDIAHAIKQELLEVKVDYYSAGKMTKVHVD